MVQQPEIRQDTGTSLNTLVNHRLCYSVLCYGDDTSPRVIVSRLLYSLRG